MSRTSITKGLRPGQTGYDNHGTVGKASPTVDGESNPGGVSSKQALIYFGIVIACFIVVYPRMIHPMVKMAFGFGGSPDSDKAAQPGELKNSSNTF